MHQQAEPRTSPAGARRRRSRRSKRLNYIVAGVSWAFGTAALLFEIWVVLVGHANAVNVINTTIAVIGTALGGILALSGDGDVILFTGADEGQRDAMVKAGMPAFSLAFWGLFALWLAYQFNPDWRAAAQIHIGVLLLLIVVIYTGGYAWHRRRG